MAFRSEKIKQGLPVREIMVDENLTVLKVQRMLNGNYYHRFTVVDGRLQVRGTISETELESLSAAYGSDTKLRDLPLKR